MIVVDTSVWIDFLGGRRTGQPLRCVELIEGGEPVALTDVIFTEVLQGLRSEDEAELVERHLRAFPILRLEGLDDFALAASFTVPRARRGSRSARHWTA